MFLKISDTKPNSVPRCDQPRNVGIGREMSARWYYDVTTKECRRFLYKVCLLHQGKGNHVRPTTACCFCLHWCVPNKFGRLTTVRVSSERSNSMSKRNWRSKIKDQSLRRASRVTRTTSSPRRPVWMPAREWRKVSFWSQNFPHLCTCALWTWHKPCMQLTQSSVGEIKD